MENRIVTAVFKDSAYTKSDNVWQWDYGQILRIQGLKLPTAVEVHFAVSGASESITRIGTTKDGVTDVIIPDSLIETGKNLVAYVYLRDSESGNTEYQIDMVMSKRAKPEAYNTPDDPELFGKTIEAVNKAADRAEKAGQDAVEAAGQAAEDAQQTAEDRKEVAKMVETVSDISEQVKKVEELSNKAQEAATKTGQDAQQTAEDRVEVGKMLETVKDASEQVKNVEESVRKAKESEQAAAGHRTAVEEMKNSVEQTASTFPQTVQSGIRAVENAGASEVREITKAGTSQKAAVEAAGTQAVESVENVKASATEAVETAKTEAVQSVQEEGTTQTGNVTEEGAKQVKAVRDKGNEVLQSIPEDFTTQMETKLNKQQGVENKGKALVIGEDGNVVPEEVASGGGDGIAIINTMSGESPLVIPDSAERVNKRLELGGKTEQVQTTGKNLLDEKLLKTLSNYTSNGLDYYYYRISGLEVGKKYTVSRGDVKTGKGALLGISVNQESTNKAKFLVHDGLGTSYNNASITWEQTTGEYVDILFSVAGSVTSTTQERLSEFWGRISYVQLEKGSTATPYEPYTGGKPSPSPEYPQEIKNVGKWNEETQKYEVDVKITNAEQNWSKEQTLTITSDRPITKWDRLVEQGGQIGWLYESNRMVLYGSSVPWVKSIKPENIYFATTINNAFGGKGASFCKTYRNIQDSAYEIKYANERCIYSDHPTYTSGDKFFRAPNENVTTLEQWKELIDENPIEMLYHTKNSEFIPLPQSEQSAIRALKTYYPTTVITVDGGELDPDIKVTYTADTKNYIDGKVSAKVASILRQYQADTVNLLSLMPMETQAAMIENDTNRILENVEEMKYE